MEHILNKILNVNKTILNGINLEIYKKRRDIDNVPEHWFFMDSGEEHYRLLCYISTLFNNETIIDIGTWVGSSALALGYNKNNIVHSFDIIRQQKDTQNKHIDVDNLIKDNNIFLHIGNVLDIGSELLLKSPFIMLDTKHDGVFENEFYEFLKKNNYKGIVLFDDILLNNEMLFFWESITEDKFDITNIGHWPGTGLVYFK